MTQFDISRLEWHTSTRTANSGANCVEVAMAEPAVFVRDSKDRAGPVLAFGVAGWVAFMAAVHSGMFDLGGGVDG